MGLFDFFKKAKEPEEETPKGKYWALTTNEEEIIDPAWERVEEAVRNAASGDMLFASLGYMNSERDIEVIQVTGDRFEALPPMGFYDYGSIYVNDGISYEETIKRFEEFYNHQRVIGYRSWETEKI